MSIMRVHKTKNFTVMSNYHFKERKMSLKAKGLLSLMLSLPDDWNYSVSGLTKLSKDGKDSIMTALSELEKFGYLCRIQLTNERGQFNGIEYHIYEQPQEEKPIAEDPITDNEKAENENAEKPPLLNTNSSLNTNGYKVLYNINNYIHILDTIPDDLLRNLYVDFLEHRNRMGKPLPVKSLEHLIERVRELAGLDIEKQKSLIRTAIINGWQNVYSNVNEEQPPELDDLKNFYT